jgi:1-aminocyclopropane-1-carboxylate deaminase/D-cysteine desulfhydrase-like pyridoxal-dependent ACC family enzyme
MQAQKVEAAAVIGGAYSNNVVGLVQLLKEVGIEPILFLRGDASTPVQGTHLLIRMVVSQDQIKWISREDWKNVETIAATHIENLNAAGKRAIVLPEGSSLPDSIPGMVTLPLDIIRNENVLGKPFDRIFMDAGTGMTAAVTLLTFAWLKKRAKTTILLLADESEAFEEKLKQYHRWFQDWLQHPVPIPDNYETILPKSKSFGAVNAEILDAAIDVARNEGVLTDPIYSTKLLMAIRESYDPNVVSLVVHSGGGLSISGYQRQLAPRV